VIREFREADAPAAVAILSEGEPHYLTTERGLLHRVEYTPARAQARWLVAEEGGEVVGLARAGIEWHLADGDVGHAWVGVRPDWRGRGIGGELYAAAEEHVRSLDVRRITSSALDDRFALRHGYHVESREQLWDIDPRSLALSDPVQPSNSLLLEDRRSGNPLGKRDSDHEGESNSLLLADLRPLGDLRDRGRELYELYMAIESTMPREEQWTGYSFEEWELDTLRYPDLDDETSIVALVDGRMASSSLLLVSPDEAVAEVEVTGTLPEFRRCGLARACKVESMRRAAEGGVTKLMTDNDVTNEPILALNRALGFRPTGILLELVKPLTL
jgi:ribosomal protein S18 acetylase RimI-like enzyme